MFLGRHLGAEDEVDLKGWILRLSELIHGCWGGRGAWWWGNKVDLTSSWGRDECFCFGNLYTQDSHSDSHLSNVGGKVGYLYGV